MNFLYTISTINREKIVFIHSAFLLRDLRTTMASSYQIYFFSLIKSHLCNRNILYFLSFIANSSFFYSNCVDLITAIWRNYYSRTSLSIM
jgi:hypothetical protein